jgi:hypothetical protein
MHIPYDIEVLADKYEDEQKIIQLINNTIYE